MKLFILKYINNKKVNTCVPTPSLRNQARGQFLSRCLSPSPSSSPSVPHHAVFCVPIPALCSPGVLITFWHTVDFSYPLVQGFLSFWFSVGSPVSSTVPGT